MKDEKELTETNKPIYDWVCQKCGAWGESDVPVGSPCGQEWDDEPDCDGIIQCDLRKVQP